jgi:hypothetical protein
MSENFSDAAENKNNGFLRKIAKLVIEWQADMLADAPNMYNSTFTNSVLQMFDFGSPISREQSLIISAAVRDFIHINKWCTDDLITETIKHMKNHHKQHFRGVSIAGDQCHTVQDKVTCENNFNCNYGENHKKTKCRAKPYHRAMPAYTKEVYGGGTDDTDGDSL